ncbi:MAG TPA: MBL fold metallo-hydrolase [Gammaproteobacteria bacterium]
MNAPAMQPSRTVAPDTISLAACIPVPGFGILPVNAYVVRAAEPMLIDTGLASLREPFLEQLFAAVDPADLRWIWLTHVDADHVGNLAAVLERAPNARVITTYLGMGKMGMHGLPLDRTWLLNPGQELSLGDRTVSAFRPPVFDAPETTALLDRKTGACFSADCFGALLQEPVESASDIAAGALDEGVIGWTCVDAPWLHQVDPAKFDQALQAFNAMAPGIVLGSHLPPAENMTERLTATLRRALTAPPFVGPDQRALESLFAAPAA